MRANPFGPVRGMLGLNGERWVPIHAVFALGDWKRVVEANDAFFAEKAAFMEEHGIVYSVMTMTVGTEFFREFGVIEKTAAADDDVRVGRAPEVGNQPTGFVYMAICADRESDQLEVVRPGERQELLPGCRRTAVAVPAVASQEFHYHEQAERVLLARYRGHERVAAFLAVAG